VLQNEIVAIFISPLLNSNWTTVQNVLEGLKLSTEWTANRVYFPPFEEVLIVR
jgi:hypothetical protein